MTETAPSDAAEPRRGRPRWVAVAVWVLVLGLLALLGFGLIRRQQGPVGVGSRMPPFTLTTFDGATIASTDLQGKVVLVNFWASWCKPCEQEAAELEQAYELFKDDGVVFLGVDYVDTETEARAYLARFGITYPNGPDLRTSISQAFRIRGVPESYVFRPDGTIDSVQIGPYESLQAIVDAIEAARSGG
ncbi:MAG TPA: TlpA disulfide reductase family protein [Anaerolineales bacterium]|nr:TlpA disulfide reductase family protein [Anaerolineales bacterium]